MKVDSRKLIEDLKKQEQHIPGNLFSASFNMGIQTAITIVKMHESMEKLVPNRSFILKEKR